MSWARPSLARKIATANILLALFPVLLAGWLQYRKERRLLTATTRQELAQVVTSGAMLLDGGRTEEPVQSRSPAVTEPITQAFRSLLIANPRVARIYVLGSGPRGDPHFLLGQGVMTEGSPGPVIAANVRLCPERGAPLSTSGYEDSAANWFSAFHPLHDRQGRVVAVLGADLPASDLRHEAHARINSILVSRLGAAARSSTPREALERPHQQLLTRSTRGRFATMTYLELEAETGEVCYASGGHLPMLRRNGATRAVEILQGDEGLPLGVENNPLLADRKIQLVEDIFEETGRLATAPPEDDLTVLAVTWTPQRTGAAR